jgi:hypothetical protein
VPWVEYDFTPAWDGPTYVWIRAIGSTTFSFEWNGQSPATLTKYREAVYWQIDNNNVEGGPFLNLADQGGDWESVDDDDWRWVLLGWKTTQNGTPSVFKLYQGSSGFNVDKIVFTNNTDFTTVGTTIRNDGKLVTLDGDGDEIYTSTSKDISKFVFKLNGGAGPDATAGSASREACNMCNPAFGQVPAPAAQCSCRKSPGDTGGTLFPQGGTGLGCTSLVTDTNMLQNDLFHDIDPLRSAQEAVKNFAARLDPKFDQIGVVAFSTGIETPRVKLHCLRYAGKGYEDDALGSGTAKCFDPAADPISYTLVLQAIEDHTPQSSTNIPEGMREGLEELGISIDTYNPGVDSDCSNSTLKNGDKHACDRRGAARRVIVLMTDGSPNQSVTCPGSYEWRGRFAADTASYNCSMYFASQAADNNVTVYTIGIGSGVNRELLTAMATGTDPNPKPGDNGFYFEGKNGEYFPAAQPDDLDLIFEKILSNIYVRIVG